MKYLACAALAVGACGLWQGADAECDYRFSGQFKVKHNGIERPLAGVKVRVKRENGTGVGRSTVTTDENGRFDGSWSFDRDQNGRLPGSEDINFAVQIKLHDEGRVKVVEGGWGETPWDTMLTPKGKDCITFILDPKVIDADALQPDLQNRRSYIYMVHQAMLDRLEAQGVSLKNQIEVIYPDKHLYTKILGKERSWFLHKTHLENDDWDSTYTQAHELFHQWDINWMKGETTLTCLTDGHHKPPERKASKRCSGFMEGFAAAAGQALHNDIFVPDKFFWPEPDSYQRYTGPVSHEALRTDTDASGAVQTVDEAERNDDGWSNFLMFMMWPNPWDAFDHEGNPDLYNLSTCTPRQVPLYEMLAALKAEAPDHGGDRATFAWFTDIMKRRVDGFTSGDAAFYQLLGNPAADPVDIQKSRCAEARANLEAFMRNLERPGADDRIRNMPNVRPSGVPVRPPVRIGD